MQYNKYFFVVLFVSIIFFSGCAIKSNLKTINQQTELKQDEYIMLNGVAEETKDGYYINEYVLEESEIQKYDAGYVLNQYQNKNIKIIGKEKEINVECDLYEQCRHDSYKIIYDIQSIKIKD